jgi:predicted ATPase
MLMAYPRPPVYEVTNTIMNKVDLEDTQHYLMTKFFLNNPEGYLRFLK